MDERRRAREAATEALRLKVVIHKAKGELKRHDYSAALDRLLAEFGSWEKEDADWSEFPKVTELRDWIEAQITEIAEGMDVELVAHEDEESGEDDDPYDDETGFEDEVD
jgi:hypothetical protein